MSLDIRQFFSSWLEAQSLSFDPAFEPWLEVMHEHYFEREELLVSAGQAVSVDFASMLEQVQSHPAINALYIRLLSGAFIRNEQREAMLLTCNAEERYLWLAENEPQLLAQVPQFHIASYIGVDPVSLSRIKRKLSSR